MPGVRAAPVRSAGDTAGARSRSTIRCRWAALWNERTARRIACWPARPVAGSEMPRGDHERPTGVPDEPPRNPQTRPQDPASAEPARVRCRPAAARPAARIGRSAAATAPDAPASLSGPAHPPTEDPARPHATAVGPAGSVIRTGCPDVAADRGRPSVRHAEKDEGPHAGSDAGPRFVLVPEIGIEPTTYALRMRRSTN